MSEQVTITISKDDAELLAKILLVISQAELFFGDLHAMAGNESWKRFSRLSSRLEAAEQTAKENAAIDDLERQFEKN